MVWRYERVHLRRRVVNAITAREISRESLLRAIVASVVARVILRCERKTKSHVYIYDAQQVYASIAYVCGGAGRRGARRREH